MPYDPVKRKQHRDATRQYVNEVRARTVCERCGAQPIEWHSEDHDANRYSRVGILVNSGTSSIARIEREIAKCHALCRSCHMALDGRTTALIAARLARLRA